MPNPNQAGTTHLEFHSRREGAYRIKIVGEDPSQTVDLLMTGTRGQKSVRLEPGPYTLIIDDFSRATQTSKVLQLTGAGHQSVHLDEKDPSPAAPPRSKPSRPSRRKASSSEPDEPNAAPSSPSPVLSERQMTLGLSVDTRPDRRGGWRPGQLNAHIPKDRADKTMAFVFMRPSDWQEKPKWRLTVAVENDVACHVPLPLFRDGVRVELSAVDTPSGPDVAVTMLPCSPHSAALVGALRRNLGGDPTGLVEWSLGTTVEMAIDAFSEKMNDPWAAAAAALLLLRSGEIGPVAQWPANLADRFPWLADAGVIAAWAHAATSEDEEADVENVCLRRLVWARRRGSLYFSAAHALAMEMLTTMVSGGTGPNIRSRAQKELMSWSRWTRRLVQGSTFVNWEETGSRLSSGTLPTRHYAILATGAVSLAGVTGHEQSTDEPEADVLTAEWVRDELGLTYIAPDVMMAGELPTFKLTLGDDELGWALSEADSGQTLDTYQSKAEAVSGGTLKKALGPSGGLVEIYSHDGHFQEERAFPPEDPTEI